MSIENNDIASVKADALLREFVPLQHQRRGKSPRSDGPARSARGNRTAPGASKRESRAIFESRIMTKKSLPARARKTAKQAAPVEPPNQPASLSFPVVGIGASAGGLEALDRFLAGVPENSGMAFVIVQHLDPLRDR